MQFLLEYSQTEFYLSLFLLMILASLISSWVWDVTEYFLKKSEKKDEFEFNDSIATGKLRQTLESRMKIYEDNLSEALERIHKLEHEGSREFILKLQYDEKIAEEKLAKLKENKSEYVAGNLEAYKQLSDWFTCSQKSNTGTPCDEMKKKRAKENAANFKKLKKQMKDF